MGTGSANLKPEGAIMIITSYYPRTPLICAYGPLFFINI